MLALATSSYYGMLKYIEINLHKVFGFRGAFQLLNVTFHNVGALLLPLVTIAHSIAQEFSRGDTKDTTFLQLLSQGGDVEVKEPNLPFGPNLAGLVLDLPSLYAAYISQKRRSFHFLYTCQCCIVWDMSEAWIKCSITIVALQF